MAENKNRIYAAIDLKSFFASVECVERKLDPLGVNLVVADKSRTEKRYVLPFRRRSNLTAFRAERGFSKSFSAFAK